jgi:hypothetical protein
MLSCFQPKKNKEAFYRSVVEKKNRQNEERYAATAFNERVIFVPQCMRNVEKCTAKEAGSYYLCAECGGCKIAGLNKKARELGYKQLYILKGGRTVEKLLNEQQPKAVVGVACFFEGAMGMELCEKFKAIVQFVPLTKDGCVNTDLDLEHGLSVLAKKK